MKLLGLARKSSMTEIERIVKNYGDLLFDLCESVLWNSVNAQLAFRSIIKEIRSRRERQPFLDYERAWVLRIACERLRAYSRRHGRRLTPSEQIEIDASDNVSQRFKKFESYFHRLGVDEKLVLLLKDKYGIPFPEIASAVNAPEDSLKIRRQQALRTLEDWLWGAG